MLHRVQHQLERVAVRHQRLHVLAQHVRHGELQAAVSRVEQAEREVGVLRLRTERLEPRAHALQHAPQVRGHQQLLVQVGQQLGADRRVLQRQRRDEVHLALLHLLLRAQSGVD